MEHDESLESPLCYPVVFKCFLGVERNMTSLFESPLGHPDLENHALEWRKLNLAKAKLKECNKTAGFLAAFTMVNITSRDKTSFFFIYHINAFRCFGDPFVIKVYFKRVSV